MTHSIKTTKVFADSYAMTLNLLSRTRNFPKHLRPTLGRRLEDACLDLTIQLRLASFQNSPSIAELTSTPPLDLELRRASENLDAIRVLLQMSKDLNLISPAVYEELSAITAEIGREIGGWMKHVRKNRNFTHSP